jgi:hypothetical protein
MLKVGEGAVLPDTVRDMLGEVVDGKTAGGGRAVADRISGRRGA